VGVVRRRHQRGCRRLRAHVTRTSLRRCRKQCARHDRTAGFVGREKACGRVKEERLTVRNENEMLLETAASVAYMRARMARSSRMPIGQNISLISGRRHHSRVDWVTHALPVERRERSQAASRSGPSDFAARDPGARGFRSLCWTARDRSARASGKRWWWLGRAELLPKAAAQ
jgi:hypothetical protein